MLTSKISEIVTPSTQSCFDQAFAELVRELNAEVGDGGYYRGLVARAPFLLKATRVEPVGIFLKVRCLPGCRVADAWQEMVSAQYPEAGIKVERDESYIYLWIDDPCRLSSAVMVKLVGEFFEVHANGFPSIDGYCYVCTKGESGVLRQSAGSIATICPNCMAAREHQKISEERAANSSSVGYLAYFPFGVLIGGVVWGGFWTLYDAAFLWANTDRLIFPMVAVWLVIFLFGMAIGWPLGRILFNSGIARKISPMAIVVLAMVLVIPFGELLYSAWLIYWASGYFDLGLAARAIIPFAVENGMQIALYKLMFALAAGGVMFETIRQKVVRLRL